jgi:multiple antibiotic resistance protein
MLGFSLFALSSLFAVIDPLGCIPFFSGQTAGMDVARKRRVLLKALLISLLVLLVFAYAGNAVLHTFGITVDAFRIAGGVIFFGIGLDMLQSRPRRWRTGLSRGEEPLPLEEGLPEPDDESHDPSVTPLAIPLIAGPGSITTVMVLRAEAPDVSGPLLLGLAILAILALTGVILWTADAVLHRLGPTGMRIIEKLMGLLVTVIAVQLILDGASPYLRDLLTTAG